MATTTSRSSIIEHDRRLRLEPLESRLLLSARAVNAVNQFGFDVYSHLQNEQGNLFFSPLSIATGLTMTYAGAAGQTAAEMEQVLHLGSSPGIHDSFEDLISQIESNVVLGDPTPPFGIRELELLTSLSNAIWPGAGFPIENDFVDLITSHYDGHVENVDYDNPGQAEDTINDWVSQETQGKIQDLVSDLSSQARMVLTNTVYFKGLWEQPFDPEHTDTSTFYLGDGATTRVPIMFTYVDAARGVLDGFDVLDVPFADGSMSMVLAMPDEPSDPNVLPSTFLASVDQWFDGERFIENMEFSLPKFQTTVATTLNQLLAGMGMPTAFTAGAADFSAMTSEGVWIDKVFHKATIEVNEQGTEAAAATEVQLVLCFAAGTPVMTPDGEVPIEQIKQGDLVLARDEFNVEGPAEAKRVEKTMNGTAKLFELSIGGHIIRTTGPHPFFAKGKGWTPAEELAVGDLLSTNHRDWVELEKITETDQEEQVYNLRVDDHRTYFVGSEAWGFGVWVHNFYDTGYYVNRPFHMMIRDNATSTMVFMGRVDDPTQLQNNITPTVTEIDADFNADLSIDGGDFLAWQRGLGSTYDSGHLSAWQNNYGQSNAQVATAKTSPESQPVSLSIDAELLDLALANESFGWKQPTETERNILDKSDAHEKVVIAAVASRDEIFDDASGRVISHSAHRERSDYTSEDSWLTESLLEDLFAKKIF